MVLRELVLDNCSVAGDSEEINPVESDLFLSEVVTRAPENFRPDLCSFATLLIAANASRASVSNAELEADEA